MIEIHTRALYEEIMEAMEGKDLCQSYGLGFEAIVKAKYKTTTKKVKP